jgi:predicted ATP-dependent serine protease
MQTSINIVPLTWAMFCGSCEATSDSKTDQCPACGAWGTLVPLSRLVNREITIISRKTA